jgi:signal transduction histidine kinase
MAAGAGREMSGGAFERLRAHLSATFINLPAEQVEGHVAGGLGRIAEFFDLERATVYELSETRSELTATVWARDEASASEAISSADDPLRWTTLLECSGVFVAPDPVALPDVWTASVPLKIGGETIGAMKVASTTRRLPWTDDRLAQFTLLAEIFAHAVARKRAARALLVSTTELQKARTEAFEREERLKVVDDTLGGRLMEAQEQERSRIARELHDDICQRLAVLAIELQQLNVDSPIDLHARSEELFNRTVDISNDVQALSHQLHCSKLEYLGIVAAIRGFCVEFARQQENATIDFTSSGVPTHLPRDVSLCLFRILQEALRNAVKHSGVRHVEAQLHGTSTSVLLTIRDRGRGFEPEVAMHAHGLGLISMRERVGLVKGTILVTSKPGWGTEISIRVPIEASDDRKGRTPGVTKHVYLIPSDRAS